VLLRLSSFPTSSRSCKSCSTDIEPSFVLGIGYLSRQRKHHTTFLDLGERERSWPVQRTLMLKCISEACP
jgi:hypothetical protein